MSFLQLRAQDSSAVGWQVSSVKKGNAYQLTFKAVVKPGWQLYAPGQDISGTPSVDLAFADSSIRPGGPFQSETKAVKQKVPLFDNAEFYLLENAATVTVNLDITGTVPAHLLGTLNFFSGRNDEFYSGSYPFNT